MAQRSEDGVGKTSENVQAPTERAKAVWTRSAISIQASSRDDGCINRPDTRKHLIPRARISPTPPCIQRGVHTRTWEPHLFDQLLDPQHEVFSIYDIDPDRTQRVSQVPCSARVYPSGRIMPRAVRRSALLTVRGLCHCRSHRERGDDRELRCSRLQGAHLCSAGLKLIPALGEYTRPRSPPAVRQFGTFAAF